MTAGREAGDEFDEIARLFRPLTFEAPEARKLLDDAAFLPARPGFDLVVTQDALVEGVHFLPADPPDLVGRKLLRVNLSDLAAKAADPYAAFLTVAWPSSWGETARAGFAHGLEEDLRAFGCALMGGDTVRTSGPLVASLTLMGWAPAGRGVERSGARPGDLLLVSGTIGDGWLGLQAVRGGLAELAPALQAELASRYRLPQPRTALIQALRAHASAAADVSDGLLADAGHIGEASGCGVEIDLERLPLSPGALAWLSAQADQAEARVSLATGGDDYEIVCAAPAAAVETLCEQAAAAGLRLKPIGRFIAGRGVRPLDKGRPVGVESMGWTHS